MSTEIQARPDAPSALQKRTAAEIENVSSDLVVAEMIRDVARMDGTGTAELQRWVVDVVLPPRMQYLIKGRSENKGGRGDDAEWETEWSASPRAEGYDTLNRVK